MVTFAIWAEPEKKMEFPSKDGISISGCKTYCIYFRPNSDRFRTPIFPIAEFPKEEKINIDKIAFALHIKSTNIVVFGKNFSQLRKTLHLDSTTIRAV